jgi:hypothetical protein
MHRGYIKLYRRIADDPYWQDEPFTRGQAWVDLILLANFKAGFIRKRGNRIKIERSCVGWSQIALAERWKWSRGKVLRFLTEIEAEKKIVQHKSKLTTLIYIAKYEDYQGGGTTDDTTDSTTDGQQTVQEQEVKELKEELRILKEKLKKKKSKPEKIEKVEFTFNKEIFTHELIDDLFLHRKKLKAPIGTQRILFGILKNCVECYNQNLFPSPAKALEFMLETTWQTIKPEWVINSRSAGNGQKTNFKPRKTARQQTLRKASKALKLLRGNDNG